MVKSCSHVVHPWFNWPRNICHCEILAHKSNFAIISCSSAMINCFLGNGHLPVLPLDDVKANAPTADEDSAPSGSMTVSSTTKIGDDR